MLGRLIRKFIIALSVAIALALTALAVSSRHGDWVLSVARNGNYRELRSDRTRLSFTSIAGWGKDQPAKLGRAKPPVHDRISGAQPPTMTLLDENGVTLTPNQTGWWRVKQDGTAILSDPSSLMLSLATTVPSSTVTLTASTVIISQGTIVTTAGPITRPTALSLTRVPTTTPGAVSYSISGGGSVRVSGTSSTITTGSSTLTFSGNFIVMTKPYTYARYSLPHAAAIALVLTPVWVALLLAVMRWRRRTIRKRRGLCVECGYDLRGSRAGAACPECGRATEIDAPADALTAAS